MRGVSEGMKKSAYGRDTGKKNLLIESACELMVYRSYREITVADITEAAGLGKGTFYLYFESKESLFREVIKNTVTQLRRTLGEELRGIEDPYERVRKAVPIIFRECRKNAGLYLAIFQESTWVEIGEREGYERFFLPMVDDFRRVIEDGIRRGDFHVRNPEVVAFGMIGLMEGLIRQWILLGKDRNAQEDYLEEISDAVADFCLHGLTGKPTADIEEMEGRLISLYSKQLAEVRLKRDELSHIESMLESLLKRSGGDEESRRR